MKCSVAIGAECLTIFVDDQILSLVQPLRSDKKAAEVMGKLSSALSEKFGAGVGIADSSAFTELVEEAIRVRGETNFRGLLALKEPAFALVDKAPRITGFHASGPLFYINRWVFDAILPAFPEKYRRAFLQTIITHEFLVSLGRNEEEVVTEDTYFAGKLLGSVAEASKMNTILNDFMRKSR